MQIDFGKMCLEIAKHLLVPVQLQGRMIAALQEYLIAAQGNRLFDFLVQHFARQHIGVGVAALAVEGAESRTPRRRHWCN